MNDHQGLLFLKTEIVYKKTKGVDSMKVSFSNSIENVEWSRMKEIYHSVGWTNHNEEKIKKVFQSSNVVTIAYDEDNIAGFGRALSDGVFNAAIYAFAVCSSSTLLYFFFFFFQAEDGIRDRDVTGQTCALPICIKRNILRLSKILRFMLYETGGAYIAVEQELKIIGDRSEERRVRKESRAQRSEHR